MSTTTTTAPSLSSGPAAGVSQAHESAHAQVAGAATYVDDIAEVRGTSVEAVAAATNRNFDTLFSGVLA